MTPDHEKVLRALTAAQLALYEHADEDIDVHRAKKALMVCIKAAEIVARRLED